MSEFAEPGYEFTIDEIKTLYKLLEHHYIHYDNIGARAVMNKMMDILKQHELSQRDNTPTQGA